MVTFKAFLIFLIIYGLRSLEEKIKNINNVLSTYNYESILICGDDSDYLENLKTNLKFNGDIFRL